MSARGKGRSKRHPPCGPASYPRKVQFSDYGGDSATMTAAPPRGGRGFIINSKGAVTGAIDYPGATPVSVGVGNVYLHPSDSGDMSRSEYRDGVKARHAFEGRIADLRDAAASGQREARNCLAQIRPEALPENVRINDESVPWDDSLLGLDGSPAESDDKPKKPAPKSRPTSEGKGSLNAPLANVAGPEDFATLMENQATLDQAAEKIRKLTKERDASRDPKKRKEIDKAIKAAQRAALEVEDKSAEILSRLAGALLQVSPRSVNAQIVIDSNGEPSIVAGVKVRATHKRDRDIWSLDATDLRRIVAKIRGYDDRVTVGKRFGHLCRAQGFSTVDQKCRTMTEGAVAVRYIGRTRGGFKFHVGGAGEVEYSAKDMREKAHEMGLL